MNTHFTERAFVVVSSAAGDDVNLGILDAMLHEIRMQLHMDVAFVSQFTEGKRVFRAVNQNASETAVQVGGSDPVTVGYCQKVVDGELPNVITDAMSHPGTKDLPETLALHIGAHLSVPIILGNGTVFGTLCCFGHDAQPALGLVELTVLQSLARHIARAIDRNQMFSRRSLGQQPTGL